MTTAIQTTRPQDTFWNDADVALVRTKFAKGVTDQEWKLFLYMANLYQLDPLIRQIYCLKYKDNDAQIFAGRDGFLAIAQRSGRLNGLQTTYRVEAVPFTVKYYDNKAQRQAERTLDMQFVATCTIHVKGWDFPVVVEVWEEEYSTGQNLWATKRRTMTGKVAECQALRKAFNISGLYDRDEVGDSAPPDVLTVDAMEVDPHTGEITTAPAKQAPRATERPAAPSGVPSPASGQAAASALRVVAAAGRGTQVVIGSDIELNLVKKEIRRIRDSFSWTNAELLKVVRAHVNPALDTLQDATLAECQQLLDVLKEKNLGALPEYASIINQPAGAA